MSHVTVRLEERPLLALSCFFLREREDGFIRTAGLAPLGTSRGGGDFLRQTNDRADELRGASFNTTQLLAESMRGAATVVGSAG